MSTEEFRGLNFLVTSSRRYLSRHFEQAALTVVPPALKSPSYLLYKTNDNRPINVSTDYILGLED